MKRILAFLLAVMLLLSLAGCKKGGGAEAAGGQDAASGSAAPSHVEKTKSWETLYNAFSEAYEKDSERFTGHEAVGMTEMLASMCGDVDLAFTTTFFTDASTAEMMYGFFGWEDVKYTESGDAASITARGEDGATVHDTLRYSGTNAAELQTDPTGSEYSTAYTLSICLTDDYWAKSYSSAEQTIRVVGYANGVFCLGIGPGGDYLSLYENPGAAADSSFATGMEQVWTLDGDTLTPPQ